MKLAALNTVLALLALKTSAAVPGSCKSGVIDIALVGDGPGAGQYPNYTLSVPEDGRTVPISKLTIFLFLHHQRPHTTYTIYVGADESHHQQTHSSSTPSRHPTTQPSVRPIVLSLARKASSLIIKALQSMWTDPRRNCQSAVRLPTPPKLSVFQPPLCLLPNSTPVLSPQMITLADPILPVFRQRVVPAAVLRHLIRLRQVLLLLLGLSGLLVPPPLQVSTLLPRAAL